MPWLSRTRVETPAWPSRRAVRRPTGPAPTMMTVDLGWNLSVQSSPTGHGRGSSTEITDDDRQSGMKLREGAAYLRCHLGLVSMKGLMSGITVRNGGEHLKIYIQWEFI